MLKGFHNPAKDFVLRAVSPAGSRNGSVPTRGLISFHTSAGRMAGVGSDVSDLKLHSCIGFTGMKSLSGSLSFAQSMMFDVLRI